VLGDAGFGVSTAILDVSSRESVHGLVETATAIGAVSGVIQSAGVSPSQAPPARSFVSFSRVRKVTTIRS
jgi:hypothetical protein